MNPVAIGRAAYKPTTIEHWANILSHGVSNNYYLKIMFSANILSRGEVIMS